MHGKFETASLNEGPENSSPVSKETLVKFEEKRICAVDFLLGA